MSDSQKTAIAIHPNMAPARVISAPVPSLWSSRCDVFRTRSTVIPHTMIDVPNTTATKIMCNTVERHFDPARSVGGMGMDASRATLSCDNVEVDSAAWCILVFSELEAGGDGGGVGSDFLVCRRSERRLRLSWANRP
jgi:hypothetical protein